MTSSTDDRPFVTRGTELGARIEGLEAAIGASRGRLDDALLDDAHGTVERAAGRLRLSAQHTVVAIAGATGSGKSTTFNALTGLELSSTGVRRPTTSWATGCVWGTEGAEDLLEWLGIPPRHQTMRDSMLDASHADAELDGVVLLDLPDHDSTEVAHHLEVDRLVQLADLLVWVLDPQKYADAAIHDRYLAPLASHAGVMVVVLNHVDTVPEDRRRSMYDDVRRLLDNDGLHDVPVYPISARHGLGVSELRGEIASRVRAKALTRERLEADVKAAAERLAAATGDGAPRALPARRVTDVEQALAEAAGVPVVVDAVERSARMRAARAVAWPLVGVFSGLRPDPLDRLGLELGEHGTALAGRGTAGPSSVGVASARVESEVRALADDASAGLSGPWEQAVRRAALDHSGELASRLDRALAGTRLTSGPPAWTVAVRVVQWALLVAALAGLAWTVVALAGDGLEATTQVAGIALPLLLLVGGLVLGIVLWLVARGLVGAGARRQAESVDQRLRGVVHDAVAELVVAPVSGELAAHERARAGLAAATR